VHRRARRVVRNQHGDAVHDGERAAFAAEHAGVDLVAAAVECLVLDNGEAGAAEGAAENVE
jgi:hypothetical protein